MSANQRIDELMIEAIGRCIKELNEEKLRIKKLEESDGIIYLQQERIQLLEMQIAAAKERVISTLSRVNRPKVA